MARHASERYSSVKVLLAIGFLLEASGFDMGLARLATSLLLELPNSRKQELEGKFIPSASWEHCYRHESDTYFNLADLIGLRLSAKACYDPEAAAK